jgi:hypothetical protein
MTDSRENYINVEYLPLSPPHPMFHLRHSVTAKITGSTSVTPHPHPRKERLEKATSETEILSTRNI